MANPLVSTGKPSDTPLAVKLHPLVLLTITDYISRHALTLREGPMVGAVVGQQHGREMTMEHAFEVLTKTVTLNDGKERILINEDWFANRLTQYKEVHADQALDLVGIFTVGSVDGPRPEDVPLVQYLKATYSDDVNLILFHPEIITNNSLGGGKLPLTLWESFYEPGTEAADKGLQVDGWGSQLQLKFRQIPFEVETGEAEMIAVDHVAKGATNANIDASRKQSTSKGKGKGKVPGDTQDESILSPEDEELVASLTSKSNAIKMLHARLNLITAYLSSLPESYLTNPTLPPATSASLDHQLLRQVSALLSRLPLLSPPSASNPLSPAADVDQVALLSALTASIASTRDLSAKAKIVSRTRQDSRAARSAREAGDNDIRTGRLRRGGPGGGGADHLSDTGFDSGADAGEY